MKHKRANEIAIKIIKNLKDNHLETLNIDFHWPSFIPSLHEFIVKELKKVKEVDPKKKKDIMYDGRSK
jgi:hypothetical protein